MSKAPDKIYIDADEIKDVSDPEYASFIAWNYKPLKPVAYLRKDALLDIIETARHSAIVQRNFNNAPTEQEARIDAYDFIIEQINSL